MIESFVLLVGIYIWCWFNRYRLGIMSPTNQAAGQAGERKVSKELSKLPEGYTVKNNVVVRGAQIDHVVFHDNDVWVIETKNYGGLVLGNDRYKYWTQVLGSEKRKFYSPVWQNRQHCEILRKKYRGHNVRSIIVFVGTARVRYSGVGRVIPLDRLNDTIMEGDALCRQNQGQESYPQDYCKTPSMPS